MPLTLLLHGRHARAGVVYQPLGRWIVPWRFGAWEAEYHALRTSVGLLDDSTQALIEVRGADRASFLQALLTNDMVSLAPGHGCRAALLDASAKLVADLLVLADANALWLMCLLDRASVVMETLDRYHFSEQVSFTNHERAQAVLAFQGPHTMAVVDQWVGSTVSLPLPGDHVVVQLQELTVRLVRHHLTDEPGVLCLIPAEQTHAMWETLSRRGQSLGLSLVGWQALNTARIEAGIPWFGIDMDTTNLLPETGLEDALASETKGCYIGQEIIARMRTYGSANKKLMGLLIEGQEVPQAGDEMVRAGETVGRVTSGCDSPMLRRPIAMGYVKRGAYEPGTAVEIVRGDHRLAATVVARPLIKSATLKKK
mgnify:CR=1 FL=1